MAEGIQQEEIVRPLHINALPSPLQLSRDTWVQVSADGEGPEPGSPATTGWDREAKKVKIRK